MKCDGTKCEYCKIKELCDDIDENIDDMYYDGHWRLAEIYNKAQKETIKWFIENGYKYNFEGIHYLIKYSHRTIEETVEDFIKVIKEMEDN